MCRDDGRSFRDSTVDFKFATAVAEFGMLLRESSHKGNATFATVLHHAEEGQGNDQFGYRSEFISMVRRVESAF